MNKTKRGFALTEVIVAIVLLTLALSIVMLSYASYQKGKIKVLKKENIISLVDDLFKEFTSDPSSFNEGEDTIYYNNSFSNVLDSETNNKIVLTKTTVENNYIKLDIEVSVDNESYLKTSRSIAYEE